MPDLISKQGQPADELTTLSKTEKLKRYRSRVEGCKRWREDEGLDDTWKRLRDLYRLKHFDEISSEDRIAVAITFATVNVIAPSVAINNPKFVATVASEDPEQQDKAAIAEAVMTYWWEHYDMQKPWRQIVKDFLVYGIGWAKTSWRYEEGEQERAPEDLQAELAELSGEANEFAVANPQMAPELPTDDEIAEMQDRVEPVVLNDRPVLERVSPFDLFVDPESITLGEATWIAQRVTRPLEDAKKDSRYNAKARKALSATKTVVWSEREKNAVPQESERVELWEFYDLQRQEVCVFTEAGDGFLLDPQPLEYEFGHPFVALLNYEVPDQFYPIGDIEAIEPLQRELDQTRSQMSEARKLDIPKFIFRKSAFGAQGIDALKSNVPYTAVPVEDDSPFSDIIDIIPRNQVSPQLYQHSDLIEDDIDLVTGVSEYARGAAPETRRTATEASIIQDAANARAADKLATVESVLGEIGKNIVDLAQQYLTGEQAAQITRDDGTSLSWVFTAEDIEGDLDFTIEAGSTQPRNEVFRQKQAVDLLTALSPFLGSGMLNDAALVVHVMKEGFGVKRPERFLGPMAGVDPMQAQMMQAQAQQGMDPNQPQMDPNAPPEQGQVEPPMEAQMAPPEAPFPQ